MPCVLFFDEIDAIVDGGNEGNRGSGGNRVCHSMGHGSSVEVQGHQTSVLKDVRQGEGDPQMEDGID
jgi:hypothetical protein